MQRKSSFTKCVTTNYWLRAELNWAMTIRWAYWRQWEYIFCYCKSSAFFWLSDLFCWVFNLFVFFFCFFFFLNVVNWANLMLRPQRGHTHNKTEVQKKLVIGLLCSHFIKWIKNTASGHTYSTANQALLCVVCDPCTIVTCHNIFVFLFHFFECFFFCFAQSFISFSFEIDCKQTSLCSIALEIFFSNQNEEARIIQPLHIISSFLCFFFRNVFLSLQFSLASVVTIFLDPDFDGCSDRKPFVAV